MLMKIFTESTQKVSQEEHQGDGDDNDDQFLPESDQHSMSDDGEMHMSPALRALMAK